MTSAPIRAPIRDPVTALACELQRDWGRQETVPAIVEIVLTNRLMKEQ